MGEDARVLVYVGEWNDLVVAAVVEDDGTLSWKPLAQILRKLAALDVPATLTAERCRDQEDPADGVGESEFARTLSRVSPPAE